MLEILRDFVRGVEYRPLAPSCVGDVQADTTGQISVTTPASLGYVHTGDGAWPCASDQLSVFWSELYRVIQRVLNLVTILGIGRNINLVGSTLCCENKQQERLLL